MTASTTSSSFLDGGWAQRPALTGTVNTSVVYLSHDAFTRDLRNLLRACLHGRIWTTPAAATLRTFARQLHLYVRAADQVRRPAPPTTRRAPAVIATFPGLEVAPRITSLLTRIHDTYVAVEITALYDLLAELDRLLGEHMRHVEEKVLPLLAHSSPSSVDAFVVGLRKLQGRRGAQGHLAWLLDGATPSTQRMVLGSLPAVTRGLHQFVWLPRYRRTHLSADRRW